MRKSQKGTNFDRFSAYQISYFFYTAPSVNQTTWIILYPFLIYIRKCFHSSNLNDLLQAVASFEIASNVRKDSCGFIFGVNTFAALFFQTVLTVVVADDIGLALPPRDQVTLTSGNSLQKNSRQVSSRVVQNYTKC